MRVLTKEFKKEKRKINNIQNKIVCKPRIFQIKIQIKKGTIYNREANKYTINLKIKIIKINNYK